MREEHLLSWHRLRLLTFRTFALGLGSELETVSKIVNSGTTKRRQLMGGRGRGRLLHLEANATEHEFISWFLDRTEVISDEFIDDGMSVFRRNRYTNVF